MLDGKALWPEWQSRGGYLRGDLAALGLPVPLDEPAAAAPPMTDAARWGLLYVLEGSRLGGAMLARRVPPGLSHAYLGAAHRDGSWGRFGDAIEAAGAAGGPAWRTEALAGATHGFALFEAAA
jgi:heme oxygenase